MDKQYDVFISSNSKDYSIAEEIYDFLRKEGLHVFLACRELGRIGEAEYADAIDTALDGTKHMIVVASSISNLSSKWVHYEWSTFRSDKNSGYKSGNLITVLTDNVSMEELPAGLRHQQSFSYSSQHELKGLLSYLRTNKKYDSSNSNNISSFNTDLLIYEYDENKLEAIVVGIQNTLERKILIPSYILYNGSNYWVTSIKDNAFEECKNLKCIFIPDTIVSIGYINNIESINIASDNPKYCSLDGVLFNKEKTELIRYPAKKRENTYTIPNGIISIKDYAFADCEELISIFIPNGLTIIKENAFLGCKNLTSITIPQSVEIIGNEAFHGCLSLRRFDVSSKNKCYHSCDDVLFDKSETKLIQYPSARKDNFYIVPNSVRSINAWAFGGNPYIKRVDLPDGLETIGTAAFAECIELSSIKLPNSIEKIGSEAFESCCKLTSIKLPDKLTTILDSSFCGCSSLASIIIPENVSVIGVNAFSSCDSLAKVILPDTLRTIEQYAFDECKSLTEVVIPSKKVVIEYKAFPKNCEISYNHKWVGNTILSSQVNESIPTAHKSRNLLKFFKLIDKSKLPLWLKRILKMLSGLGVVLVVIIFTLGAILLLEIFKGIKNNANDDYKYEEITDTVCQPIDLGLPSKTLWGDRNIGAKNAIDFGDLYAWGETNIKEDYSRSNYVEQVKPFIQITTVKYDAAMAVLGAEWRLPREEQFTELLNECQWTWITRDGHKGYQINGKNGNSIFLPAAGWIRESEIEYRNTYGYYWTSERSTSSQFARCLQFPKDGIGIIGNGYLNVGRSIRAVYVNDVVSE